MPLAHVPDIPWHEQRSPSGKFHSFCRNLSLALGGIANTGIWGGGHPFDVQIRRIPAGAAVCPFHSHVAQWEFFLVQAGTGTIRAGTETRPVRAGDVFIHPPGEPHQLVNTGNADLEVLIVADNPQLDAFHYPDSNKWGLRPPGKYFRITEVGYFDGEEPAVDNPGTYRASPTPAAVPITAFNTRKLNLDDVTWDTWESPKKTFQGASKELSIALGAKRNTPTGLGGHPFEVELGKLEPNQSGCPYHSHAAQWEMFLIVSGTANVRTNEASLVLGPGDTCMHVPGTAHQIRNASATDELQFLLIADNPPVDYWRYPDSGKWGLRSPRMFFRPTELDYYDGEE